MAWKLRDTGSLETVDHAALSSRIVATPATSMEQAIVDEAEAERAEAAQRLRVVSSRVLHSPELVESLVSWLWPSVSGLLGTCSDTRRIGQALARDSLPAGMETSACPQRCPAEILSRCAHIFLFGGSGQPSFAAECFSGVWQLVDLPSPEPAHDSETSAAAVGDYIYVTSDVDHPLGPGQAWPGEDEDEDEGQAWNGEMSRGQAFVAQFEPRSGAWSKLPAPPPPEGARTCRTGGLLAGLRDDLVYLGGWTDPLGGASTGGETESSQDVFVFDRDEWAWRPMPPLKHSRLCVSACEHGGRLYSTDGVRVESYDAAEGRWRPVQDITLPFADDSSDEADVSVTLVSCAAGLVALAISLAAFEDTVAYDDLVAELGPALPLMGPDELGKAVHDRQVGSRRRSSLFAIFVLSESSGRWHTARLDESEPGPPCAADMGSPVLAHGNQVAVFGAEEPGRQLEKFATRVVFTFEICRNAEWHEHFTYRWAREPLGSPPSAHDGHGPVQWTSGVALPLRPRGGS